MCRPIVCKAYHWPIDMYCSASHQLDLRSARIDTELGCWHGECCRSRRSRYDVVLSVLKHPYVMLSRGTEVPPIVAFSVHIETSVIQDLQAREEWGLVSGQDKPTVTGGLVSDNDSFHISSRMDALYKALKFH